MSAATDAPPPFARRYSGFFGAATPGTYQFSLTSDDGSLLWLDGATTPLIDNNAANPGLDCGVHVTLFPPALFALNLLVLTQASLILRAMGVVSLAGRQGRIRITHRSSLH